MTGDRSRYPLHDFDAQFQKYALDYAKDHRMNAEKDLDKLEGMLPQLYLRFINKPQRFLSDKTPALFFSEYGDPRELIEWLCDYERAGIPVPDLLLERVKSLKESEAALMEYLVSPKTPHIARLTIVSLLSEMSSAMPVSTYIEWIKASQSRRDDLVDIAADALISLGASVVEPILAAIGDAKPAGQSTFVDILCSFPGDGRILRWAIELFKKNANETALFASYLGKLGDPSAIPALLDALQTRKLNYLDFIETRNAIEALGGDVPLDMNMDETSFHGDPYYESLKSL